MPVLSFALSPEAVGRFYESLVCLGKFSEAVTIEASRDRLVLTALNSTKSAYASFTLVGSKFFTRYVYSPGRVHEQGAKEKFTCKIHNKALIPVFKGRAVDPTREKDTSIEKCEVIVEDGPEEARSRFIIKMACRNGEHWIPSHLTLIGKVVSADFDEGVLKTYRLTFESVTPMHAVFKHELVKNRWAIASRTLREFVEHFAPKTEQLDIYSEDGRVNFMSYTEKVISGNDVLKQPLQTTIAIDTQEFSEFSVEERLHVIISVKDFKAIVTHAGISNTVISALYSYPMSPMLLKYNDEGMVTEFILMTIGDFRASSATPSLAGSKSGTSRAVSKQPLEATSVQSDPRATTSMPPPPRSAAPSIARESIRTRTLGPSPPPPQPSLQSNALFFPEEDEDRRWDPVDEEDEEMLAWDTSGENTTPAPTLNRGLQGRGPQNQPVNDASNLESGSTQRLPPTQRVSQVRGLFDD